MSAPLLLLALALQGADAPAVTATLDRDDVIAGEVVTLTITVASRGAAPVQVVDPVLGGFEVVGFREQSAVAFEDGVARRRLTRELRLVARAAGTATIGPVRARQGEAVGSSGPLTVRVRPAESAAPSLAPAVRALVEASTPHGNPDQVTVEVATAADTVPVGGQVDLVTLAWFPRDVRAQLRTPPTLEPPAASGAWVYERAAPSGIVASRLVDGRWYDLFVNHQVLFPLVPGRLQVDRAVVRYRVPLTFSFLSRELEHVVESDSVVVTVTPFPAAGRPAGFAGASGSEMTMTLAADDTVLTGGSTLIHLTLTGRGNVALWPEPRMAWPTGLRVYPVDVETGIAPVDGRIAGTKRFAWLVVADSGGTLTVPPVRYPWFDQAAGRYRTLAAGPLALAAPPRAAQPVTATPPLPLLVARPALIDRLAALPRAVPVAVLLAPPLLLLLVALWRRRPRRPPPAPPVGALSQLEQRFRARLAELVPADAATEPRRLEIALRAAGLESALAQHAARVAERLRAAVFGRHDALDEDELAAEADAVLAAVDSAAGRHARWPGAVVAVLALAVASPVGAAQSPEALVDAGAWRSAADSFLARADAEPALAAHWYNAGVALAVAGDTARAAVAWTRAARLAPRRGVVQQAFGLVDRDVTTRRLVPVFFVRPAEWYLLAAVLWLAACGLLAFRRRVAAAMVTGAAIVAVGVGVLELRAYQRPVAFAVRDDVRLREAPYGPAAGDRVLAAGQAAIVERAAPPWLLVRRGGARGWVLLGDVARL